MKQTKALHLIRIVLVFGLSIFASYAAGAFVHESIHAYASIGTTQTCYLGWWPKYQFWAWIDGDDESGLDHNENVATFFQLLTTFGIGVPLALFLSNGYLACGEKDENTADERQRSHTPQASK